MSNSFTFLYSYEGDRKTGDARESMGVLLFQRRYVKRESYHDINPAHDITQTMRLPTERTTPHTTGQHPCPALLSRLILNSDTCNRIWFRPRVLRDVTKVDWSTKILGHGSSMPVYIVSGRLSLFIYVCAVVDGIGLDWIDSDGSWQIRTSGW